MRPAAVFLPNWIGDAVMATPAVRAVFEHSGPLVAVGPPLVLDLFEACPWFVGRVAVKKSLRGTLATTVALRRFDPSAALLFPNSFRSAAVARAAGCQDVVGYARYGRHVLLSKRLYAERGPNGTFRPTPVIDDYNRVAAAFGTRDPGHRMELFVPEHGEAAAAAAWNDLGLHRYPRVVGLNPGGAFGAGKHWAEEKFAEVAKHYAELGCGVVVLCGPAERPAAARIAALAGHPAVVTLANFAPTLALSMAVVNRLALMVTTDSGPRHFAAAFGVPVVSLFGPTHIAWTETYWAKAVHLQLQVPCGPCQKRACPLGHHRCMADLHPAAATAAGDRLLAAESPEVRRAG